MSTKSIKISSVRILGEKVDPIEINFTDGLNLVGGASDTGKSYLYQLIDSLLGKNSLPKEIDEAKPYTQAVLEVTDGKEVSSFVKDLQNGSSYHFTGKKKKLIDLTNENPLNPKHSQSASKKKGISNILLEIMDCPYNKVRKNVRGDLAAFSFRFFAHETMINEDIIYTGNPYFMGGQAKQTSTMSKEALLTSLSGIDDLSLDQFGMVLSTEKISGQLSEIDRQIQRNRLLLHPDEKYNEDTLNEINDEISQCKKEISTYRSEILEFEQQRSDAHEKYVVATRDFNYANEVVSRISLLRENYESDLKRIEFIDQSNYYLEQFDSFPCPICGQEATSKNEDLGNLVLLEKDKLQAKLDGLKDTLIKAEQEVKEKNEVRLSLDKDITLINNEIQKDIQPILSETISELEKLIKRRNQVASYQFLESQIHELEERQEKLTEDKTNSKQEKTNTEVKIAAMSIDRLCEIAKTLLEEWGLFETVDIGFDFKSYDLIVNGKSKSSYGKGYKALINSAYAIANFLYAHEKRVTYPGFVIIDSPLIVFSPKYKDKKDVSLQVSDLFYKSIAERLKDYQIIIFENKLPSSDVINIPNFIEFTQNERIGRYGLFPPIQTQ